MSKKKLSNLIVIRSELKAVESLILEEIDKRHQAISFEQILEIVDTLKQWAKSQGAEVLFDYVRSLEDCIQYESTYIKTLSNPIERVSQYGHFFSACFQHLESIIESYVSNRIELKKSNKPSVDVIRKKRVLIVDDSETYRVLLSRLLQSHPALEVIGTAPNAMEADKIIETQAPDVITLDINMPEIDGFAFLNLLLKRHPISVILISSIGAESGRQAIDALYQGAISFIPKETVGPNPESAKTVGDAVYQASCTTLQAMMRFYTETPNVSEETEVDTTKILAIAAGPGSTRTLIDLLTQLPANIPPTVIVQQAIPKFSESLIEELLEVCPFVLKEPKDGEVLEPKKIIFAPNNVQMTVVKKNKEYCIHLVDGEEVNAEKPSADVLFDSIALSVGSNAVGVLLSGDGTDGAEGLRNMRKAGAYTIVQDESDCIDPNRVQEAIRIEAATLSCFGSTIGMNLIDALVKDKSTQELAQPEVGVVFEGQGPRILIVDDSPTIRAVVRYNLRTIGLSNFVEARDGMAGWGMLIDSLTNGLPISLVLCDQNMPQMTGKELLLKVRAHSKLKEMPFILVTSQNEKKDVTQAIYNGVTDYITKPISARALLQKATHAIQSQLGMEMDARLAKLVKN